MPISFFIYLFLVRLTVRLVDGVSHFSVVNNSSPVKHQPITNGAPLYIIEHVLFHRQIYWWDNKTWQLNIGRSIETRTVGAGIHLKKKVCNKKFANDKCGKRRKEVDEPLPHVVICFGRSCLSLGNWWGHRSSRFAYIIHRDWYRHRQEDNWHWKVAVFSWKQELSNE